MTHKRFVRRRVGVGKYAYWHVWTFPIILGMVSIIGLLSALIGDSVWDALSWLCLAIPLGVLGWFVRKAQVVKR